MTTLIPKIDLKNGGSTPAGAINRPINQKIQEFVSVNDFGAVGDGTTDDTAAIRAAITYAESLSTVGNFPHFTQQIFVIFEGGKQYKVVGNNPMGHDFATYGYVPKSYAIDFRGAEILWTQTGVGDVFVDYASMIFNFSLLNGTILVTNTANTVPNGSFVFSHAQSSVSINYWLKHTYQNLKVNGGTYGLSYIFNIDGGTQCDQSVVRDCEFLYWERMWYSTNSEAVDWGFYDSSFGQPTNNFRMFQHATQWSGGMRIINCELSCYNNGIVFYATSATAITTANNGFVYVNSRIETQAGKTICICDAQHGRYEFVGFNCFAGGGDTLTGAVLRDSPEITFKDCIVPNSYSILAQTPAQWDVTHANGLVDSQLIFDNCIFESSEFVPTLFDTIGNTGFTLKTCLNDGYLLPIVRSINSAYFDFAFGISKSATPNNKTLLNYVKYTNTTGNQYVADTGQNNDYKLPGGSLITSVKVNTPPVSGTLPYIGIFYGTSTVALAKTALSTTLNTVNAQLIPSANFGISVPYFMDSVNTKIWFAGCDASGNLLSSSIQGWAEIEFINIQNQLQIPSTMSVALV